MVPPIMVRVKIRRKHGLNAATVTHRPIIHRFWPLERAAESKPVSNVIYFIALISKSWTGPAFTRETEGQWSMVGRNRSGVLRDHWR